MHGFPVGFPQAAADAVLTEGLDGQLAVSGRNGLLNLFFENP
jgi:hypothetical protein